MISLQNIKLSTIQPYSERPGHAATCLSKITLLAVMLLFFLMLSVSASAEVTRDIGLSGYATGSWTFKIGQKICVHTNNTLNLTMVTLQTGHNSANVYVFNATGPYTQIGSHAVSGDNANFSASPLRLMAGECYYIMADSSVSGTKDKATTYNISGVEFEWFEAAYTNDAGSTQFINQTTTAYKIKSLTYNIDPINSTPPLPPTFSISLNISNATATLQGSAIYTFSTSNGTIITNISTGIYNITLNSSTYWNYTKLNHNVSSNLAVNMTRYPYIAAASINGTTLLNFNVTLGSTEYTTTTGIVYVPANASYQTAIWAANFFTQNISFNFTNGYNLNLTLWQAVANFSVYEAVTGFMIYNFTAQSNYGMNTSNAQGIGTLFFTTGYQNVTINKSGYIAESINFTASALTYYDFNVTLGTSRLNITVRDITTNLTINNFSINISSSNWSAAYSTTTGYIAIILINSTYNLTIWNMTSYFNITNSTSFPNSNITLYAHQSELNVHAIYLHSGESILSFAINESGNFTTAAGGIATVYPSVGVHKFNLTATGYGAIEFSVNLSALEVRNITINLTIGYLNISLFKETTNSPFNVSETVSTVLLIYCSEHTQNYTLSSSSSYVAVDCPWELLKLDIAYNGSSYYRTLIPEPEERNITFYVLDLLSDSALQVVFRLNDLTGDYGNGTVRFTKFINGTRDIIEQKWDVEQKVVAYLLYNAMYTLSVIDNDGSERSLGYFIADSAGERSLTLPSITYVPAQYLGGSINWAWNLTNGLARLQYNDTDGDTTSLYFYVYNASNSSQILYQTTSYSISYATFSYITPTNTSYVACFRVTHSDIDDFGECKTYGASSGGISLSSFDNSFNSSIITTGLSVLVFLVLLALIGHFDATVGLLIGTVFLGAMYKLEWFWLGTDFRTLSVLVLLTAITGLSYFFAGWKK